MVVVASIEERNAITDAVICIANTDGSWVVYQLGDQLPAAAEALVNPQE